MGQPGVPLLQLMPLDVAAILGHLIPLGHDFFPSPTAATTPAIITSSPYTITSNDIYIRVDTTSVPITLNIPNPALRAFFYVKDVGGLFETNNCTLARFSSEAIEDLTANKILQTNFGGWLIWSDGTNYWIQ